MSNQKPLSQNIGLLYNEKFMWFWIFIQTFLAILLSRGNILETVHSFSNLTIKEIKIINNKERSTYINKLYMYILYNIIIAEN